MSICETNFKDMTNEIFYQIVMRELEKIQEEVSKTFVEQSGKIADVEVFVKEKLCDSIRTLLDSMNVSGELSDIITNVVLVDILDRIEQRNVFYNNINTSKLYDDVSQTYYYHTTIPRYDENGVIIPLKMGIANDDKTCSSLEGTLKHAWRKNATICTNCGIYNVETSRPVASIIYEGKILYKDIPTVTPEKYQYFAITKDNKYKVYPIGTTPESMVNDNVYYACAIFNSLIIDGEPVTQTDLRKEPRQSIGFTSDGSINIISCDGRNFESAGMSYDDLARIHALNGSINAYILDGGGSTSTVLRGVKQNENVDNFTTDRSVGTFLYVSKETDKSVENNIGNDLGRVKHFLLGQIRAKTDFPSGYINLRGQEGFYFPGVIFYVDGEETRRSRLTLSYSPTNPRDTYLYISLKANETEKTNLFRIYDSGVWSQTYHGPSSSRPNGVVGLCYFDETLKKPIWYNGSAWVDSTGTTV